METSYRVDPSDQPARSGARPLAARNSDAPAEDVTAAEVALEDDESLDWFVNLLPAENASKG